MANEQTLQPPTETKENSIFKDIAAEETGDSINQSQNERMKIEEVDQEGNSTNSQSIDRQKTLTNSVDRSDEILSSPRDDLEPNHYLLKTTNDHFHEIFPNSIGGSPSISPSIDTDVDLEAGQNPPQSPCWRPSIYPMVQAIDCIVTVFTFVLEVAQIMSNNNMPLKWVVLGFTIMSCLITWMLFALNSRQENARFSFGCFFLPHGHIYGSICRYIDSYASIVQVMLSIISIIVMFPKRLIIGEVMISSAMISSKLTASCTKATLN